MHASNGILFNHESPIRGETFVTRKITRALARIALGMQDTVFLGNLSARRDWGHAKDYIRAMYLVLQQEQPDDYVIATGITTSIRDFVKMAAAEIGLEISFRGEQEKEKGLITAIDTERFEQTVGKAYLEGLQQRMNTATVVAVDPAYYRPAEVDLLIGDPSKAKAKLNWSPRYDLKALIADMMQSDIKEMQKDRYLQDGGYRTMNFFE